jgi:hypothetical protein
MFLFESKRLDISCLKKTAAAVEARNKKAEEKEIARLSNKRKAEAVEECRQKDERKAIEISRLSNKRKAEEVEECQRANKRDIQHLKLLNDFKKLNKKHAKLLDQVRIFIF